MSTRIADLPDSGMSMMDTRSHSQNARIAESDSQNTYIPMNVHPNPYGNPVAPTSIDHPVNVRTERGHELTREQQMMLERTPIQQLPSRDIRMDTADYMQDVETIPNYIPSPKTNADYVNEHEQVVKDTFEKHRREKYRESRLDLILTEIQVPLMIGLLYFAFQLPYINLMMNKYLPFLSLYNNDGNLNFNGLLLKSVLFGTVYYASTQIIEYLTVI